MARYVPLELACHNWSDSRGAETNQLDRGVSEFIRLRFYSMDVFCQNFSISAVDNSLIASFKSTDEIVYRLNGLEPLLTKCDH